MDDTQTFSRSIRATGIPRPSRLPLPRSATTRNPSPSRPDSRLDQSYCSSTNTSPTKPISFTGSIRGRPPPSLLPTPRRTTHEIAQSTIRQQSTQRQPLGTIRGPQAKAEPTVQHHEELDQALQVKIHHDPEEQENNFAQVDELDQLDETVAISSNEGSSPPNVVKKGPRPSLSDRTILSLSQVPPTPGSERRRSAFFNPHSPMTPAARPPSAMSSISKLSYGSVRKTGIAKPTPMAAPPKRANLPVGFTPRRSISSSASVTTASKTAPKSFTHASTVSRPASAAPTGRRSTLLRQATSTAATSSSRPPSAFSQSVRGPPPIRPPSSFSQSVRGPPPTRIEVRPKSQLNQSIDGARPVSNVMPTKSVAKTNKPTSSAALRDQIAQARAAHRINSVNNLPEPTIDFDDCYDPFNQKGKEEDDPLQKRLETARREGRLHIAAMGLKEVPKAVMTIYDEEAMQQSSISWSECVDLSYFNAADNEIEEIPGEVFPDLSNEELADMPDAKGNQFGGLETLDLHGNMLQAVPMGLRRLERLTVLNLSRNNLTNAVFTIVSELSHLRHLHLASNDLSRVLPDTIASLYDLETLDLSDNKLVLLPPCIHHLSSLRVLNISSNRFSDLSLDALAMLPHLAEIYASKNALTGSLFPSTVTTLPSLKVLDVSKNSIASLAWASSSSDSSPPPLKLPALIHLNISSNRLIALPDISSWTSLTHLLAEENGITALPMGFSSLPNLRSVDLTANDLRVLDDRIASMDALESLRVGGNPLREKKFLTMATEVLKRELGRRLALAEEMEGSFGGVTTKSQEMDDDEIF